jgi:adenosylcobyric acid synthase
MDKHDTAGVNLPLPTPGQRPALCVMVLGTSSGAGKSWVATALCAWYHARGFKVAPFKAQNMSNNARVVAAPGGAWGEIGTAQYLQALAAGCAPDVRMNPLLLKPEADMRSQVVLLGQVSEELSALPWRGRSARVWPRIAEALDSLRADNDVVDIDRGGAFAHLYGTWALLPPDEQALIRGFVLNKFRGDAGLLAPAPQMLQERTGVPTVATIPMQFQHGLPEEDGVFDDRGSGGGAGRAVHTTIAIIAYPRISNLDEFQPLLQVPGLRVAWARTPAQLAGADWIILPGSKATACDLAWLRSQGLDAAIAAHAAAGGQVLGICGGLQMLGEALIDLHGVDGNAAGLGLLPLTTLFAPDKTVKPAQVRLPVLPGALAPLSGVSAQVYEIHHGQTSVRADMVAAGNAVAEPAAGLLWHSPDGRIAGCYWHGLFESPEVLRALWGAQAPTLDSVFARMAEGVQRWFAAPA